MYARLVYIATTAIVVCLALLVPLHAFAQTCNEYKVSTNATGWNTWSTSPDAALSAYVSWRTSQVPACGPGVYTTQQRFRVGAVQPGGTQGTYEVSTAGGQVGCPGEQFYGPYTSFTATIASRAATCPEPNVCETLAALDTPVYISVPGSGSPGGTSCNAAGCSLTFSGTVIRATVDGKVVTEGDAKFTGSSCTPDPQAVAAPDTCPGGTSGEVNGATVCVDYDPNTNVIESVKPVDESTTTDNGDGTPDVENVTGEESTKCVGNTCTTTKTTTVGGVTKTETKTEDREDFCTTNPRSKLCVDSRITSSCSSFTCEGDAIDCEIARKAQESACKLFKDVEAVASVGLAAADSVYEPSEAETTSLSFASAIDQTDRLASSCPGDVTLQVASATVVLPFSKLCGSLQLLGNLAVGLSLLAAAFIVFRGN